MTFGEEVRRLRKEVRLSQVELAAAIGLTQSAITQIETDRMAAVSVASLYKLCDALKVNCDHFRPFLAGEPIIEQPAPEPARPMGKRK